MIRKKSQKKKKRKLGELASDSVVTLVVDGLWFPELAEIASLFRRLHSWRLVKTWPTPKSW